MPDRDADCIFCRIVADELPATFVHRGATASAFMDTNPVALGHLLVIPNRPRDELERRAEAIRAA